MKPNRTPPYALLIAFLFSFTLSANPIIVFEHGSYYDAKKESESCIVLVGKGSSAVSCYVDYSLKKNKGSTYDSYYLQVALPIFIPENDNRSSQELITDLSPKIEIGGKTFYPYIESARVEKVSEKIQFNVPPKSNLIFYHFTIELGLHKKLIKILASYEQPHIAESFIYAPLFERGKPGSEHKMDILRIDKSIFLDPIESAYEWETFEGRLKTNLRRDQIIQIRITENTPE